MNLVMIRSKLLCLLSFLVAGVFFSPPLKNAAPLKDRFTPQDRQYWAFQEVKRPELPRVRDAKSVRNPVDNFILARLESKGLSLSAPAEKSTLLRRAAFDLIGLPPTEQQVDEYLTDRSPKAFAKAVDRLLASPHYGERWARHWLDLARYAESEGFKSDETRPNAWRYRDYVIQAFNQDKPYDRFIQEQIAGDELWPDDFDARIATAFNRHYPDESNAQDLLKRRQEILNDITDTVGAVFLGLTYGCARCHDHKFDPITQADYYRMQAFFANVGANDEIVLWAPDRVRKYHDRMAAWQEKTRPIRDQMETLIEPERRKHVAEGLKRYPSEIRAAVNKPPSERTPIEWQMYYRAKPYLNPSSDTLAKKLKDEAKDRWQALQAELEAFAHVHPGELPMGTGIMDISHQAPPTHTLSVGVYDAPIAEVQPGFPSILDPGPVRIKPLKAVESTGRRTTLADWLASPRNSLTARVMVNRIWHHHFGRGIVATPSDFGRTGDRPTHPALLDWLADEFIRSGWSIKHMHRLIMGSNTYQQASVYRAEVAKADPENRLWWRFSRHRLEGEVIRDSTLFVAGLLNTKMGGASVFPDLPSGMVTRGGWEVSEDPAERNRRSIYVFVRRNTRYPMLEVFDMPDTHESCGRRHITTTPTQAFTLLNSELTFEWAQAFAERLLRGGDPENVEAQIERAYRLAYSRPPDSGEMKTAIDFFSRHRAILAGNPEADRELRLPSWVPEKVDPVDAAVLVDFCHMLMNSNEFVYQN